MLQKKFHTDLAAEARSAYMEQYSEAHTGQIDGVLYTERNEENIGVSEINVLDAKGEEAIGKSRGQYITVSFGDISLMAYEDFSRLCHVCAREITKVKDSIRTDARTLLVCGIGNAAITPDAIGPQTLSHLTVTHILKERDRAAFLKSGFFDVCAIAPGVSADTGMNVADVLRLAVKHTNADIVIAVDALAAGSEERLCKTVQISSAGISPGSGIGNRNTAIDKNTIGVPVIALGVPTVIHSKDLCGCDKKSSSLLVCPGDIDAQVKKLSMLLGFSVNLAFHKNYPLTEMLLN